jgi:DNA-binding MarR family transcriptional regulator
MHVDYKDNAEGINFNTNSLSLEEQAILNIIKNNSSIKQEEIATLINKSLRTVKNYMAEMQEKGLIERKNGKRDGEWIIINN